MRYFNYIPASKEPLFIDGESLTLEEVVAVARYRRRVRIAPKAENEICLCRAVIDVLLEGHEKIYGLTTGFGKLRDIAIPLEDVKQLQENLIRSHSCGVGDPFSEDVVRAAILLRANTLCRGHSGIRLETVRQLLNLLNDDILPYIPEKGSVGASGDLAPLSHLGLVLIGNEHGMFVPRENRPPDGRILYRPNKESFVPMPSADQLEELAEREGWNFRPIELEAKEGLALNNGTQFMTAVAALAVYDAFFTIRYAEMAGAMSLESIRGVKDAYDDRLHELRNHEYQLESAQRVIAYCEGSQAIDLYFNTAHLNHAAIHLNEALEFHNHVTSELTQEKIDIPDSLVKIRKNIENVKQQFGTLLPMSDNGTVDQEKIRDWANKPHRKQIQLFHDLMNPVRQSAIDLIKTMEQEQYPTTSSLPRLRSALVGALDQLNKVVPDTPIIQDDYSFRCFPQVLACGYSALWHVCRIVEVEINSATDNPLLFPPEPEEGFESFTPLEYAKWLREDPDRIQLCREGVIGGGNFHGEPIAIAMDYFSIAMAEVANIAERRIAHLVDDFHSRGLPPFLIESSGLNSGFMVPQYTAAALVSENKVLAHPASVDSIPTCANTEDHVSMGTISARKAAEIIENVRYVIAIEILAAFQGLNFRKPLEPGFPIRNVIEVLQEKGVKRFEDDRAPYPEIDRVKELLSDPCMLDCLLK